MGPVLVNSKSAAENFIKTIFFNNFAPIFDAQFFTNTS